MYHPNILQLWPNWPTLLVSRWLPARSPAIGLSLSVSSALHSLKLTASKFTPENQWLEDEISFWCGLSGYVSFRKGNKHAFFLDVNIYFNYKLHKPIRTISFPRETAVFWSKMHEGWNATHLSIQATWRQKIWRKYFHQLLWSTWLFWKGVIYWHLV